MSQSHANLWWVMSTQAEVCSLLSPSSSRLLYNVQADTSGLSYGKHDPMFVASSDELSWLFGG
jgi:hypothetical protein